MNLLITGGSGYIGRRLALCLARQGHDVTATIRAARQADVFAGSSVATRVIPDLQTTTPAVVTGYDAVIHAAGRAHKKETSASEAKALHRRDNLEVTLHLAQLCRDNGVKRFLVIGSIGASVLEKDVEAHKTTLPEAWERAPYRASKLEAERQTRDLLPKGAPTEGIVVRIPMLYGKDAPGNFSFLSKLVAKRLPLPIGGIDNRRAFVSIDTLCSFIEVLLTHPKAAERIWEIRDRDEVSTPAFVRALAEAQKAPCPTMFHVPAFLLSLAGRACGIRNAVESLVGDLRIDLSPVQETLGWSPALSVEDGLKKAFEENDASKIQYANRT